MSRREQQILDFAGEHSRLDCCADGDYFVRVHAAMRLLAEEGLHDLLNFGHARLAADEDDFVDVLGGYARVGHGLLAGLEGTLDQVADQLLELGAGELADQVLGSGGIAVTKGRLISVSTVVESSILAFSRRLSVAGGPFRCPWS